MELLKYLKNVIQTKEKRAADLRKMIKESDSADEVRKLGDTLNEVLEELKEAREQLEEAENGDDGGDGAGDGSDGGDGAGNGDDDKKRSKGMRKKNIRGAGIIGAYNLGTDGGKREEREDPYDSEEYRMAFMEYTCRNVPMPQEFRAAETTTTADAGAVIPTTIANEIIRELKSYGNLYAKTRKMNIQGGVEIPISDLVPEAHWIGEDKSSDDQKLSAKNSVSFKYYGLECKIAQTLLASVVTLDMFQELFVQLAVEAITKALDAGIVNGTGNGQMLGITKDSRVPEGNKIALTESEMKSWGDWKKKVFGKMKKSYRNGDFIMAQGTFDGYIDGMTDTTGQPIGRVNYGIDGGENYRFGGKNVETVEDDIIKPWDEAEEGDVVAVFTNLNNYIINSNMEMTIVKWTDHDNNKLKNKCILIADGKLGDAAGTLIITKGAAKTSGQSEVESV